MKKTACLLVLLGVACSSDDNPPAQPGPVMMGTSGGGAIAGGSAAVGGMVGSPVGTSSGAGGRAAGAAGTIAGARSMMPPTAGSMGGAAGQPTTSAGAGSSAAGSGGVGGAAMPTAGAAGMMMPAVACNPADKGPAPTVVTSWREAGMPPTGSYKVVIESDPGVPDQTIYRPEVPAETKMPVIVWGEGGCIKMGLVMAEFLYDVASHGFLIIADGPPSGGSVGGGPGGGGGSVFKKSIDWAIAENDRPCSQYYRKIDTTKIAASGQSCGGLMTLQSAGDQRLTTIAMFNSGLMGGGNATLDMVHTPAAYFNGGQSDIAYANGARDYAYLAMKADYPLLHANNKLGHGGTYNDDNGGECGRVGVAWFRWHLLGDESEKGKGMFWGPDCGLCNDSGWTVESVNMGR